ncbi:enoyl CoA hydratase domain-containing protein 1 [Mortierella claussenii]|nr:enoyl CoA hydratase domain-containing protein 1 [Mortierella claussenii]
MNTDCYNLSSSSSSPAQEQQAMAAFTTARHLAIAPLRRSSIPSSGYSTHPALSIPTRVAVVARHATAAAAAAASSLEWTCRRTYACQIRHPTKLGQLRAKLRKFGQGHIELDLNHASGLALLTLSNPARHNALTGKMMAELADCVDFLEDTMAMAVISGSSSSSSSSSSSRSSCHSASVTAMASGSGSDDGGLAGGRPGVAEEKGLWQLHPESGLVLKSAGKVIKTLDDSHQEILQNLVGIVVTGADQKSYCAGLDLSDAKTTLLTPQGGSDMSALMVSTLTRFMRLPLITIAAIEKAAIGGGAEMTTFCDHRCLSDQAKVQFVQTQMGVVTAWGGASRLISLVPRSMALRLLASAEPIRGGHKEEAVQSGFAQVIAPVGKAVETATEYMQQYVWEKRPTINKDGQVVDGTGARRCVNAVRTMKKIVSFGLDHDRVERVSEMEKDFFKQLWGGPDNLARVEAASSKKK